MENKLLFAHHLSDLLFNQIRFPGSRKFARLISNILLPKLTAKVEVPTKYNFRMNVHPNGGKEIYHLGFYEVGTLDVIGNCLKHNDVFIDIGASIGLMSVFASQCVGNGRVLSFEPQSERFKILSSNKELNNCKNIKPFNNGLGQEKNQLKLYTDIHSPSLVDHNDDPSHYEVVDILVLDEVLKNEKINNVKFIKIDVEGFEIHVLKGAKNILKTNPPIICVEYVKRLQKLNDSDVSIYQFIKENNDYKIFQLEKTSSTKSKLIEVENEEALRDMDNIYCFTKAHLDNIDIRIFKHQW